MCCNTHKGFAASTSSPDKLLPRRCPASWTCMLWSPLEIVLVCTTSLLGIAGVIVPAKVDLPAPGSMAAVVQGVLILLHGLVEGPRLQLFPVYAATLPFVVGAVAGEYGGWAALQAAMGALVLLLVSLSFLLCYYMPRMLPVGGRGPFGVGIATEHIRTPVAAAGESNAAFSSDEEPLPLEFMALVFYPVDKSCVAKLPWFPSSIGRFRRSLAPIAGETRRVPFGLTQMGIVAAGVILGLEAVLLLPDSPSYGRAIFRVSSFSSLTASAHAWVVLAALCVCLACLVSDVCLGISRSAYKIRYLSREQATRIATFVDMPGWITAHVCGFHGPGYEAGHFFGQGLPCFPAAPVSPGEGKRPVVIFSHGLGGNRAIYAEHGAAYAAQGYVAVFIEHNDGSGSSCMLPDGRITEYASCPNPKDLGAPDNHAFRLAQLRRRGRELRLARAHLAKLVRGSETDFEACRLVGLGNVIDIKRPALVGHSFGGGTVLQVLSDDRKRRSSGGGARGDSDEAGYSMAFVMDPWTFPLSEEAKGQNVDIPVVFITTDGFLGEEGERNENRLVDNAARVVREGGNELAIQFRVKDARHNNFSDSTLFAPEIMQKLRNAGGMDGVAFIDQVTRLTLCALEVFLRRRTGLGGAVKTPAPADLASAILGSDLPAAFPQARVRQACAGGVLPSTDSPSA